MGKENEKEIGEEFHYQFLPPVGEKTIGKISKKLLENPKKFVNEVFNQMDKKNPGLRKFLLWKANQYFSPHFFLLGNSFVYSAISEEFKKNKKSFLKISPDIYENLSNEMEDEYERYFQKIEASKEETLETIKNNFQTNSNLDENSETEFTEIKIDDIQKFKEIINNFCKKSITIKSKHKQRAFSIIPPPASYYKENPFLMRSISIFSPYGIKPPTSAFSFSAGAMLHYETLRRQAETDYLEEKSKSS